MEYIDIILRLLPLVTGAFIGQCYTTYSLYFTWKKYKVIYKFIGFKEHFREKLKFCTLYECQCYIDKK